MSGKWFNVVAYGLDPATEEIDYDRRRAPRPGAQAEADRRRRVGLLARHRLEALPRHRRQGRRVPDGRHGALRGPVAAGVYPSPVGIADFVTSTTHKTLRGPRGGFILARRRAREADQLGDVSRTAGRAADARHRRQGGRVQGSAEARVQDLPGAGARERARAGDRAAGARAAHRLRPHRLPHVPGRPARQEDHRQGRRGRARPARTSPSTRTRSRTIRRSRSSPAAFASAARR